MNNDSHESESETWSPDEVPTPPSQDCPENESYDVRDIQLDDNDVFEIPVWILWIVIIISVIADIVISPFLLVKWVFKKACSYIRSWAFSDSNMH